MKKAKCVCGSCSFFGSTAPVSKTTISYNGISHRHEPAVSFEDLEEAIVSDLKKQ